MTVRETLTFVVETAHRRVSAMKKTYTITVYREGESGWFCDNVELGCSRSFRSVTPNEAIGRWLAEHDLIGINYEKKQNVPNIERVRHEIASHVDRLLGYLEAHNYGTISDKELRDKTLDEGQQFLLFTLTL